MTWRFIAPAVLAAALGAALLAQEDADPFQWLEEIEGKAQLDWVRAQNARTLKELQGDPVYPELYKEALQILTSQERLPIGDVYGNHVYNFRQDDRHVRGIWRRTSVDSYKAGTPQWQVLLDIDSLAAMEAENWAFEWTDCLAPKYDPCLIRLSRGGSDAAVTREFSVSRKAFVKDGFVIPEGKNRAAWIDKDTLLVSSDWGEGRTQSGYPRAVRKWKRGTPFANASKVFEGERKDVRVGAVAFRHGNVNYPLIIRTVSWFE